MARDCGKRDPVSHRNKCQMKDQYPQYQGDPKQIRNRTARNAARSTLAKEGLVSKGDGMEVHHESPIVKGGSNKRSNLSPVPRSKNRAHGLTGKKK